MLVLGVTKPSSSSFSTGLELTKGIGSFTGDADRFGRAVFLGGGAGGGGSRLGGGVGAVGEFRVAGGGAVVAVSFAAGGGVAVGVTIAAGAVWCRAILEVAGVLLLAACCCPPLTSIPNAPSPLPNRPPIVIPLFLRGGTGGRVNPAIVVE